MDRKSFIRNSTLGLLIAVPGYSLLSCSGSDDSGPTPNPNPNPNPTSGNCLENGTIDVIGTNHNPPHNLTVSKADVAAGTEKTYQLSPGDVDNHTHNLTITTAQFATLATNVSISADSTSASGHAHKVTVSCA